MINPKPWPHIRYLLTDKIRQMIIEGGANRSCITCEHFDEPKELCIPAKARPPARVIALGCDSYIDNEIPF